jgi:flagellar biosynthesis GTPase FlhF
MSTQTRGFLGFRQRPALQIDPLSDPPPAGAADGAAPPQRSHTSSGLRMSSNSEYVSAYLAELAGAEAQRAAPEEPRAVPSALPAPVQAAPAAQAPAPERPASGPPTPLEEAREARLSLASAATRPLPASMARSRASVERTLARAGFSEQLASQLTETALVHTLALSPRQGLVQAVRSALAQRIPVAAPLPTSGCSIVIVGAGGSGKTSCCASLLSAYRAHSTMRARFATLVRGQEDGLELILAPELLEPAPADGARARRELRLARESGLVVIDTPRLSPSQPTGIREVGRLLGELEPDRVVVALPSTLGSVAAEQLLAALEPLGASSLALTHADETDQIGVGIELACRFGLAPELILEHSAAGGMRLRRLDPAELAAQVLR